MFTITGVEPEDLLAVEPQAEQALWFATAMNDTLANAFVSGGPGRTVRHRDGTVLLCCGLVAMHPHLAHAWTLISVHASPHMFGLVKTVRAFLEEAPFRRVEMSARSNFTQVHKWARLLGFSCEGIMRCYAENGEDHHLYARVKQ